MVLFSSGDTSCSDPVPMVTMPRLTELFIKIADFFKKVSRKDCGQMCNNSAEVTWQHEGFMGALSFSCSPKFSSSCNILSLLRDRRNDNSWHRELSVNRSPRGFCLTGPLSCICVKTLGQRAITTHWQRRSDRRYLFKTWIRGNNLK